MIIKGRPISKKNNHVGSNNRFFITSKRYKQWETEAMWQVKGEKKWTGKIVVHVWFSLKGNMDADLDNLTTSVLDVLQKAGVIDNDKNVVKIDARKQGGYPDWSTEVLITKS